MRCSTCKRTDQEIEFSSNPRKCKDCKIRSRKYWIEVMKPKRERAKMKKLHSLEGIWKPVIFRNQTYTGYFVSDNGKVFGQRGNVLTPAIDGGGYYHISLHKNKQSTTVKIHHIVTEAFWGPKGGLHVNHKDGNKLNNNLSNLEYVTPSENKIHAVQNNLANQKLIPSDIKHIIRLKEENKTSTEIAEIYDVSISTISLILNGKTWAHLNLLLPPKKRSRKGGKR